MLEAAQHSKAPRELQGDAEGPERGDVDGLGHPQDGPEGRRSRRRDGREAGEPSVEGTDDGEEWSIERRHEKVKRAGLEPERTVAEGVDGVARGLAPQQRKAQRAGRLRPRRALRRFQFSECNVDGAAPARSAAKTLAKVTGVLA